MMKQLAALAAATLSFTLTACGSDDSAEEVVEDVVDGAQEGVDEAEDISSSLADILRENGLENAATAVLDVDLAELADTETFTFFAPSDEAFQALEAEDVADLLGDPDRLEEVLRNHLVDERIAASDLTSRSEVDAVGGASLSIESDGDDLVVADATVSETDIEIDDGVVHVVDRLFLDT